MKRALIIYENNMGHQTHGRFLRQYGEADERFDAVFIPLEGHFNPLYPARLIKPVVPVLHRYGADFWAWRQFQYKKWHVSRALKQFHAEAFDLVYVHTQTSAAIVRDRFPNARLAVSIDLTWRLVSSEARYRLSPLFEPLFRLEHRIFQESDVVLSFSDWAANSVIQDYNIAPSKVQVVRQGMELPAQISSSHSNDQFEIGFIGNDFARKGGDVLLQIHQEHFTERAHLTLITDTPLPTDRLKNVTVRNAVPWEELMTKVLPRFDLFVLPSRFDYSPYVIIEAKAMGIPVIATKTGAIPEMIHEGDDGFTVALDDADDLTAKISWVLEHPDVLIQMGQRARANATKEYHAERNYHRLFDILAEQVL